MCPQPRVCRHTNLLFISVAAKLVLVVDALAVVYICVLLQLQPLEEAVARLYGPALVRRTSLNTDRKGKFRNTSIQSRMDLWYLLVLVAQEVGKALSPPLPHFQGLHLSRAKYKWSKKFSVM